MSKRLPPRPHLDPLKKQVKTLLKAHRAADPEAVQRIRSHTPKWAQWSAADLLETSITLQDAQHVIAGEYGFTSWPKLVAAVAAWLGRLPIVELLIAAGADIDAEPEPTDTALSVAADHRHAEVVERLIQAAPPMTPDLLLRRVWCGISRRCWIRTPMRATGSFTWGT